MKAYSTKAILCFSMCLLLGTSCYPILQNEAQPHKQIENTAAYFYVDENVPQVFPYRNSEVKFFFTPSSKACHRLGIIESYGNGYANFEDLLNKAKRTAAQAGADFIVLVDRGYSSEECYGLTITRPWANFSVWVYS